MKDIVVPITLSYTLLAREFPSSFWMILIDLYFFISFRTYRSPVVSFTASMKAGE